MYDDWKELIAAEMQRDLDEVMDEIEADPAMKNIEAPEEMYDGLMAMIDEHERREAYEQLSDEDKELIRLGKVYRKQRKFDKFVVALAAVIVGLGLGSVCIGEGENPLVIITRMLNERKQTGMDLGKTEPDVCDTESEAYEKIEESYGFSPVKLEYLPDNTIFYEATFSADLQSVNMIYEINDKTSIIYVIRPNYREASLGTDIEDEKIQDYELIVNGVEMTITEYDIAESGENRWSVHFVYQDVQYLLRVTNMKQGEVENIVNNLRF